MVRNRRSPHFRNDCVQVDRFYLQALGARERKKLGSDLRAPLSRLSRTFQVTPNIVVSASASSELPIAKHRGEEIVEIMGYSARHLADDFDAHCRKSAGPAESP
jgi:hypothetical protein